MSKKDWYNVIDDIETVDEYEKAHRYIYNMYRDACACADRLKSGREIFDFWSDVYHYLIDSTMECGR